MTYYYKLVMRKYHDERAYVRMNGDRPKRPDSQAEERAFRRTPYAAKYRKSEFIFTPINEDSVIRIYQGERGKPQVIGGLPFPKTVKGETARKEEPVKGVRFGKFIGPSGRARSLYDVQAFKRGTNGREENAHAYGGDGVQLAKKSIHRAQEKRGIKALRFRTYNQTTKTWRKRG